MVQYFATAKNQHHNIIKPLVGRLIQCAKVQSKSIEILINCDSGKHNNCDKAEWESVLRSGVDKLVVSDNIHELRAYNKLAGIAKGNFFIMLQDDRLPSLKDPMCKWMADIHGAFEAHPEIACVGINDILVSEILRSLRCAS